jgi:hypothetical protein
MKPKLRTATKPVLNPNGFRWFPRGGKIIDLVIHFVIVRYDFGHRPLPPFYQIQAASDLLTVNHPYGTKRAEQ